MDLAKSEMAVNYSEGKAKEAAGLLNPNNSTKEISGLPETFGSCQHIRMLNVDRYMGFSLLFGI